MIEIKNKTMLKILQILIILFIINLACSTQKILSAKTSENLKFDNLDDLRKDIIFKKEDPQKRYIQKRKSYNLDIENDCTKKLNINLGISKEENIYKLEEEENNEEEEINKNQPPTSITVYTILCYFGSSKSFFDKEVKKIYKVLGEKIKDFELNRDYSDNYYIVNIGNFFSKLEAQPFRYLSKKFKNYRIKKIEIQNNYENVINLLNKNVNWS